MSAYIKEIKNLILYQRMKAYWKIYHSSHYFRFELLYYFRKYIRRQLPKKVIPLKVWIQEVENKNYLRVFV